MSADDFDRLGPGAGVEDKARPFAGNATWVVDEGLVDAVAWVEVDQVDDDSFDRLGPGAGVEEEASPFDDDAVSLLEADASGKFSSRCGAHWSTAASRARAHSSSSVNPYWLFRFPSPTRIW